MFIITIKIKSKFKSKFGMTRSSYRICAHVYILTAETRIFMLF